MDTVEASGRVMTGLEGFITLVNDPNQIRAFYDLHKSLEDTPPMLSFEHYMLSVPEIDQLVEEHYEPAPYSLKELSQLPKGSLGQVYAARPVRVWGVFSFVLTGFPRLVRRHKSRDLRVASAHQKPAPRRDPAGASSRSGQGDERRDGDDRLSTVARDFRDRSDLHLGHAGDDALRDGTRLSRRGQARICRETARA